jgi:hypothetical protein
VKAGPIGSEESFEVSIEFSKAVSGLSDDLLDEALLFIKV